MQEDHPDLRKLRETAGLSQAELAELIGVDQSAISRLERDPSSIQIGIFKKWCQVCGTPIERAMDNGVKLVKSIFKEIDAYKDIEDKLSLLKAYADFHGVDDDVQPEHDRCDSASLIDVSNQADTPKISNVFHAVKTILRKPRVAFCGEYDSGKSRMINTFIGHDYLPSDYNPTTKITCLLRHARSKPAWQAEEVWIFEDKITNQFGEKIEDKFNIDLVDDRAYCEAHKVIAGGQGTLRKHGAHDYELAELDGASFAVIYIDAPILLNCDVIDLPGYGYIEDDEHKIESIRGSFDVLVFLSKFVGFLGGMQSKYLISLIERLPVIDRCDKSLMISNIFIVATHTHNAIDDATVKRALSNASTIYWKILKTSITQRFDGEADELDAGLLFGRTYPFWIENERRRNNLESDLQKLLYEVMPSEAMKRSMHYLKSIIGNSCLVLEKKISSYESSIKARANSIAAVTELRKLLDSNVHDSELYNKLISGIDAHRNGMADFIKTEVAKVFAKEYIKDVILKKFSKVIGPDGKEHVGKEIREIARSAVFVYITELARDMISMKNAKFSKDIELLINDILSEYKLSIDIDVDRDQFMTNKQKIDIPFDVSAAFMGALANIGTAGALSVWASSTIISVGTTASSIGASIFSWIGLKAVAGYAAAALASPTLWVVGIAAVAGWIASAIFGSSWEERLAGKIASKLTLEKTVDKLIEANNKFWSTTESEAKRGFDALDAEYKKAIKAKILEIGGDGSDNTEGMIHDNINKCRKLITIFTAIPWETPIVKTAASN